MNKSLLFSLFVSLIVGLALLSTGCNLQTPEPDPGTDDQEEVVVIEPEVEDNDDDDGATDIEYALGWFGDDDIDDVPTTTNFGFGSAALPSSVDLIDKFPPIGDQNPYGTCVAWAVAYNLKTAINGMSRGLNSSQLASANNQFSPKDLFTAIPDNQKGNDCNGTNFSNALNLLQNRGVATMQTVPYNSLGNCSSSNVQASWTSEAAGNKIEYWRKIEGSVNSIKQNLANNIPVVLGARLADNFMSWNSDAVLSSSTTFNNVGQHAYHAMIISGYDDNMGANGAFRVINSWGTYWGDRGYIWVDYNYMINEFCTSYDGDKPLFIAADANDGSVTPPNDPTPPPSASGVDLAPWVFSDYSNYQFSGNPTERVIDVNVYNIGTEVATPNGWSIYYIYYNAFDANDYGVLFYDHFTTNVPQNTFYCPTGYNCEFNVSIPAGGSFTQMVWGLGSQVRTYYMPQITGNYYLLLIADPDDLYEERDELNNLFYTTQQPKYFENGYSFRRGADAANTDANGQFIFDNPGDPKTAQLQHSGFNSAVNAAQPNAYTPAEIKAFLKQEKASGRLDQKIQTHIQEQNDNPYDAE